MRVEDDYKVYKKDIVQDSEWNSILLFQLSYSFTILQLSVKARQKFVLYTMFINGDAILLFFQPVCN